MCHNLIIILHLEMKDPNHLPLQMTCKEGQFDVVEPIQGV